MDHSVTTISRDQLYDRVWQTPMIRLAAEFGLSDNGLRKICKRLAVPCPPAGWWAKKTAGKAAAVTPLPEPRPGTPLQARIAPVPDDIDDLRDAVRREARRIGMIEIPERLARAHPVIAGWIAEHRKRQDEARRHRREWSHASWTVPDLTPAERRRHRVLHALFQALEKQGATVAEDDRRHLFAALCGETIEFSCHEKSRKIFRPLTEDEKRWRSDRMVQELQPTGRLEFQVRAWIDQPLRKVWLETDRQPAEAMLPEIVATFLVLGPLLAERTRQREEQQRRWEEEQRRRELERQRRQQDDKRWQRFVRLAEGWKSSELARDFIARLRELEPVEAGPVGGRTLEEWLEWAEGKAGERDPVARGGAVVFAEIARIEAWSPVD